VIPFGHYPFYCSKYNDPNCKNNTFDTKLQPFLKYLTDNKIELYLGAHLHLFRRSKPVGLDGKAREEKIRRNENMTIYVDPPAPTFIIEGSGGGDYFFETDESLNKTAYPLEAETDVQLLNTGFSILTSYGNKTVIQNDHYLGKDGSIGDSFAILKTIAVK